MARVRFSNWIKSTTSIAGGGLELEQGVCGLAGLFDAVGEREAEVLLDQRGIKPSSSARVVEGDCPGLLRAFIGRLPISVYHPAKRGWPDATRRFFGSHPQVTLEAPSLAIAWPSQLSLIHI